MLRQLAAPVTAAAREGLNKGLAALARVFVVAALGAAGAGLLLAAALIGLSLLIGPLLACSVMGLVLVLLAVLIGSLQPKRPVQVTERTFAPDQLAFAVGFVLARWILSRRK